MQKTNADSHKQGTRDIVNPFIKLIVLVSSDFHIYPNRDNKTPNNPQNMFNNNTLVWIHIALIFSNNNDVKSLYINKFSLPPFYKEIVPSVGGTINTIDIRNTTLLQSSSIDSK